MRSFAAIELLTFLIMKNSIFIAQESSQYLVLKNYIPWVKRVFAKKN